MHRSIIHTYRTFNDETSHTKYGIFFGIRYFLFESIKMTCLKFNSDKYKLKRAIV